MTITTTVLIENPFQRTVAAAEEVADGLCDLLRAISEQDTEFRPTYELADALADLVGDLREKRGGREHPQDH